MPLFKSRYDERLPLDPLPLPLGPYTDYCLDHPVTLIIKEKVLSWSGDDFTIKDTDGNAMLKVDGKVFKLRGDKTFTDITGAPLYIVRNKLLAVMKQMYGTEPQTERELFRMQRKFAWRTKMTLSFFDAHTKSTRSLYLEGNWWGGSAHVLTDEGQPVAHIQRQFWTKRELLAARQTYYVTVAPGMDVSLISALVVCFDEAMHDHHSGGGGGG